MSTEIVDAVARAAALQAPEIPRGIDLAAVELEVLASSELEERRREELLTAARELASFYLGTPV